MFIAFVSLFIFRLITYNIYCATLCMWAIACSRNALESISNKIEFRIYLWYTRTMAISSISAVSSLLDYQSISAARTSSTVQTLLGGSSSTSSSGIIEGLASQNVLAVAQELQSSTSESTPTTSTSGSETVSSNQSVVSSLLSSASSNATSVSNASLTLQAVESQPSLISENLLIQGLSHQSDGTLPSSLLSGFASAQTVASQFASMGQSQSGKNVNTAA